MANFHFTVVGGKVEYLYKAGKDIVKAVTPLATAEWHAKNMKITNKSFPGQPDFCICSGGEYFFQGTWDKPAKKRKNDQSDEAR